MMKTYHLVYSNDRRFLTQVYVSPRDYTKEDFIRIVSTAIADGLVYENGVDDLADAVAAHIEDGDYDLHRLSIRMIKDNMVVLEPDKTFNLYGFGPREVKNES